MVPVADGLPDGCTWNADAQGQHTLHAMPTMVAAGLVFHGTN